MPLMYITGVPGAGKSTVRKELLARGFKALGGAEDSIAAFYEDASGKRMDGWKRAAERTPEWLAAHTWKIPRFEIEKLRQAAQNDIIFICAVTANDMDELWDLFDKVFALYVDEKTLRRRIAERTNNDVGKLEHELIDILQRQKTAKQKYESLGAVIIDATQSVSKIVDDIITAAILA